MDTPSPTPKKDSTMKIIIGVVVAFAVLMVGCKMMSRNVGEKMLENMIEKNSGEKTDVDIKDGSMTFTTEDGTVTTGNDKPDNWPADVAMYPGAQIQFSGSSNQTGKEGVAMLMMTSDSAADVTAFYKKSMADNGWKIESTMQAQGSTILIAKKDTRAASATISSTNEGTTIMIGVQAE